MAALACIAGTPCMVRWQLRSPCNAFCMALDAEIVIYDLYALPARYPIRVAADALFPGQRVGYCGCRHNNGRWGAQGVA